MRFGEIRIESYGPADQRRGVGAPQLMSDHAQQMVSPRIFRIRIACETVEPLRLAQATGAMLGHRGYERLFRTAPGTHDSISKAKAISRKTDSARGQGRSHRGCHRPRPADRRV